MDIITKIKTIIEKLYANKLFKFIFFTGFFVFVIYKYSNIKNNIIDSKKIDSLNIPKKITSIRSVENKFFEKLSIQNTKNEKKTRTIENFKKEVEEKEEEQKKLDKILNDLKKEFSLKNNSLNKSNKKVILGNIVNLKMVTTIGDTYNPYMAPINIEIKIDNNKNNLFSKYIINKRVGDIVIISFKDFLKNGTLQREFEKAKKEQNIKDINVDFNTLANQNIIYRVKIVSVKKK